MDAPDLSPIEEIARAISSHRGPDGSTSVVASCDLYGFAGGKLTEMTSYNIELPDAARAPAP